MKMSLSGSSPSDVAFLFFLLVSRVLNTRSLTHLKCNFSGRSKATKWLGHLQSLISEHVHPLGRLACPFALSYQTYCLSRPTPPPKDAALARNHTAHSVQCLCLASCLLCETAELVLLYPIAAGLSSSLTCLLVFHWTQQARGRWAGPSDSLLGLILPPGGTGGNNMELYLLVTPGLGDASGICY